MMAFFWFSHSLIHEMQYEMSYFQNVGHFVLVSFPPPPLFLSPSLSFSLFLYLSLHIVMKTPIKPDFCIYHTFKMGPVSYVGPIFIYWARDPIIHGPNINIELKLIINISLINTTLSSHNLILGHKTLVCLAISEPGDTMLNYFIQYIN